MTAEDEEFNRIEMESRIKQEYVRAMRKKVDDDFEREYAKWEHSPKHQMFKLMDELAIARVLVRELGDRLAKLEKTEQESVVCCQQYDTCLQPCTPRGEHLARRTWVGLTDDDCLEALKSIDAETKRLPLGFSMFAANIQAKLREKNNV